MQNDKPIPRSRFFSRRVSNVLALIFVCVLMAYVCSFMNNNLWHSNYFTGYLLLGSIVFLTAFNLRKKLTFLPSIGTAATWMQLHIYVGLATFLMFGYHVAWRIPDGWLEGLLAMLYLIVAFSGVYGLVITRVIPRRLTAIGHEVVFERIPEMRMQVANDAHQTALGSLEASEVIAKFYLMQMLPFFERPRGLSYFLVPSGRRKRQLIAQLSDLQRYLSPEQREISHRLSGFVQQKDDLDYHRAMQGRLKIWLFFHIGFTYSLLAVSIFHTLIVHAFIGSGL